MNAMRWFYGTSFHNHSMEEPMERFQNRGISADEAGERAEFQRRTATDHEVQLLIQEFEDGDDPCHWRPSQILNMLARYVDRLATAETALHRYRTALFQIRAICQEERLQIFEIADEALPDGESLS